MSRQQCPRLRKHACTEALRFMNPPGLAWGVGLTLSHQRPSGLESRKLNALKHHLELFLLLSVLFVPVKNCFCANRGGTFERSLSRRGPRFFCN